MRIAIVGTRGIPASYSGFETYVEELGARLVERGHQVTVYCRSHHIRYPQPCYRGMRLVKLPTVQNKYLDTIAHTALSCLHLLPRPFDLVLMCIAGNGPLAIVPRLAGKKVVLNVDGLDWQRDKWPAPAKYYIQGAEYLATRLPHTVVTDSRTVARYYRRRFGARVEYIAYGATAHRVPPGATLARLGLEPGRYILYVGRLVPENCAHHLVDAFARLRTDMKCVIVGDAPYMADYIATLKAHASDRVIFPGYVFGEGYWELNSNAYAYAFTSAASGTHPALLEAMACGNCVVAQAVPTNVETGGDTIMLYDGQLGGADLAGQLQRVIDAPDLARQYGERAARRVATCFNWDRITDQYETLFTRLVTEAYIAGA